MASHSALADTSGGGTLDAILAQAEPRPHLKRAARPTPFAEENPQCDVSDDRFAFALKHYRLPDGILPLAPSRTPFVQLDTVSCISARALVDLLPEKCGPVSSAIRATRGESPISRSHADVVVESHVDAYRVSTDCICRLLCLGFEIDGFREFMPRRFTDHFTFKLRIPSRSTQRRRSLMNLVRCASVAARDLLSDAAIEGYVEMEVYPYTNRRHWSSRPLMQEAHSQIPALVRSLERRDIAIAGPLPSHAREPASLCKRADIHIKLHRTATAEPFLERLIEALSPLGYYVVVTWAGSHVLTGQFGEAAWARRAFGVLDRFFTEVGGAVEMTLESCVGVWRSHLITEDATILAEVPPIVR